MGPAAGNATEAAKLAGYSAKTARQIGSRLLTKVDVANALTVRQAGDPAIATREERQRFWASTMRSADVPWKDRLRASELLGKSGGDFVERHEHQGEIRLRWAS